jgi:hypothetical protein
VVNRNDSHKETLRILAWLAPEVAEQAFHFGSLQGFDLGLEFLQAVVSALPHVNKGRHRLRGVARGAVAVTPVRLLGVIQRVV